jgi:hypothetical protein
MGEVYRAKDSRVDRAVALKVLPEEFFESKERRGRFEREARTLASLSHPGIAVLYSFEEVPDSPVPRHVLAMELVEGETLRELLAGRLTLRQVLDLGAQIADALATAHDAGIVHRDLKPENVMVTKAGRIKVLDFGLARRSLSEPDGSRAATATATLTESGLVVGTASYMSPEQARGAPVDLRSDQFALGAMLYEMLAGRRAFARPTSPQTLAAIIEDEPEPLAAVAPRTPAPLRWVVERCLAKTPKDRYDSTRDLARELATLRDRMGDLATSDAAPLGPGQRRRTRPLVLALLLAGVAAAAGFLAGRNALRGGSVPLRFEQITFGQWGIWSARFAPDGSVVFSAPGSSRDERGVRVHELFSIRPGTPERRPLGIAGNILAISRSGEMAILQAKNFLGPGTLALAPLGGGVPREILTDVLGTADWSPDGKSLAILHRVEGKTRLEFPVGHPVRDIEGFVLRVSPNGRSLALATPTGLCIVEPEGDVRVLGHWPRLGFDWRKDGRGILLDRGLGPRTEFLTLTLAGAQREIASVPGSYVLHDTSPDGRALTERFSSSYVMRSRDREGRERDLGWLDEFTPAGLSADGRLMLFNVSGAGGGSSGSVYVRGTDGSPPKKIAVGIGRALSRDGRWALCCGDSGAPPLTIVPTGPGEVRTLDAGPIALLGPGGFLPDGTGVWFNGIEAGLPARRCYVQAFEGGPPRALPAGVAQVLAISPDGAVFAVSNGAEKNPELVNARGGERRPVPGSEPGDAPFVWSLDGRSLFLRTAGLPVMVQRVDLTSGRRERVAQLDLDESYAPESFQVFLSEDGRFLVYGAQRFSSDLFIVDGLR